MEDSCVNCKCSKVCLHWDKFLDSIVQLMDAEDYRKMLNSDGKIIAKNCKDYIEGES